MTEGAKEYWEVKEREVKGRSRERESQLVRAEGGGRRAASRRLVSGFDFLVPS